MYHVSPLDVIWQDSQQCRRNRMAQPLVAIAYAQSIDLHVLLIWQVEDTPNAVCIVPPYAFDG
jgi:hypothetical protein